MLHGVLRGWGCREGAVRGTATIIRINAGGPDYTDTSGNLWSADTGYNTGSTWWTHDPIANTVEDTLYKTERWDPNDGTELEYSFTVPNGSYQVRLLFADIAWNTWGVGYRVFGYEIEGTELESALDIYATVGELAALDRVYTVSVTDGELNIRFLHVVEDPKIAAIEIIGQ